MNQRYRAWRFLHPDLDVPEAYAGIQLSPTGGIEMVAEEASVRQAILLLLSTRPGERIMRPTYGCDLYRLVFSPNDDTTAGLAIHYVRRALERWEPRIDILRLDANRNPAYAELLDVILTYRVRVTRRIDTLQFSLRLTGEV
ncbi:MAG: GPW/gp25 family protein [Anaerolineales bacterium]|nr:GPW/gp25 family protein [Anaerolineales bacterium]MCB8952996.1 GPW/gp25 family protein [Ardenticatenales bacterium]